MSAILERDFGTPPSHATQTVTLEIDGMAIVVPAGTSVMRAAAEAGVSVPKLCATDTLEAFGSCRLCLVEIEGRAGTPASCTTPVAEGMKVRTQSDRLQRIRKGVVELYVSEHPLDCAPCVANGHCELQTAAKAVGLEEVRYPARPMAEVAIVGAKAAEHQTTTELSSESSRGHSMSDPQKYRSKEEVEAYKDRDPIEQVKYTILEHNILTQAELDEIDAKIKVQVQESVDFAETSPFPDKSEAYKDVYVEENYPFIEE